MRRASYTDIWSCLEITFSATMSLAKARMSPLFWSMTTRISRAGPTAFLAADNKASSTAATRTSRLMPFSRSQKSRTAKKSAFRFHGRQPLKGNKKVGRLGSSDFGALANQQINYRPSDKIGFSGKRSSLKYALKTGLYGGSLAPNSYTNSYTFCNLSGAAPS